MKKFLKGLIIGGVIGYISGLFTAPKSGKEMQEEAKKKIEEIKKLMEEKEVDKKIQKIFGEISERTKEAYYNAQMAVVEALAEFKGRIAELDLEEYKRIVSESLDNLAEKLNLTKKELEELKKNFSKRVAEFKKAAEKKTKKRKVSRTKKA